MPNERLHELIQLVESRIFFIEEELLPDEVIAEAKALVLDIDSNDFAFVAMANHLNALLWTGDKVLTLGLRAKGYTKIITTQELGW